MNKVKEIGKELREISIYSVKWVGVLVAIVVAIAFITWKVEVFQVLTIAIRIGVAAGFLSWAVVKWGS